MMMRGDIHYVSETPITGSEQMSGRPAIIVSNDTGNVHSPVVEVVFLTTRPKSDLPTHVTIRSSSKPSTALCEQITSVSVERLGDYAGTCTEQEMAAIDTALCISLALTPKPVPALRKETVPVSDTLINDLRNTVQKMAAERDMYKSMYNDLINNILNRRSDN